MTVANGTGLPIARAYFRATVASPGRSVPWIREDFNYEIPGGLEPGERAEWKLEPNRFGAWGREVPADAVLTVEVVKLDGADGKPIADARGLTDREVERLEQLRKRFG